MGEMLFQQIYESQHEVPIARYSGQLLDDEALQKLLMAKVSNFWGCTAVLQVFNVDNDLLMHSIIDSFIFLRH